MKSLLPLLFLACLGVASAQTVTDPTPVEGMRPVSHGKGPANRTPPPVNSPEPLTIIALAGGAALAGGLLRRRRSQR
jgi:hypothetical protein